jgi:hypothetical protein
MDTTNTPLWLMALIVAVGLIVIVAIVVYGSNKRSADRNKATENQLDVLAELAKKAIEHSRPTTERPMKVIDAVVVEPRETNGQHSEPATAQRTN